VSAALAGVDRHALRLLRTRFHTVALERAAIGYTTLGESGALWVALALAGAARDPARRGSWLAAAALVPVTLGGNFAVKRTVRRERPRLPGLPALGRAPETFSFPSAHAATSFAGATVIGTLVPAARTRLRVAAALMALTRPYLGVHYPSDVLAGAALGRVLGKLAGRNL
jgi:undecaprenyl-diphosphatase